MSAPRLKAEPKPLEPADYIHLWQPGVRAIEPDAELDFSFSQDAITICDMRRPAALRYGVLFTRAELNAGEQKKPGEIERRVRAFMARG